MRKQEGIQRGVVVNEKIQERLARQLAAEAKKVCPTAPVVNRHPTLMVMCSNG